MKKSDRSMVGVLLLSTLLAAPVRGEPQATPLDEPVLEPPTLHCLGAYWIIRGDDNQNATVSVEYRKAGQQGWRRGGILWRVEKGAHRPEKGRSELNVPDDAWLFAGSVVSLEPATAYELKLTLSDRDGGRAERVLQGRTITEPAFAKPMRQLHVVPGKGGGAGSKEDPFCGLDAAQAQARPGDRILLHAGVYPGPFIARASGEIGKPIIWQAAGDGDAIIDGQGAGERASRGIGASNIHDVWFENLIIRNANYGLVGHGSARLVLRGCRIHDCDYGLTCTGNDDGAVADFFIADNVIEGPCRWPRTKGIENPRGIIVTGSGHVVCYNRISGFSDGIDTFPSRRCAAIDFHNNEISEMTDDGVEMDYSQRNTRCFSNRITNVYQGISGQPVHGGPVYVFRNLLYNVAAEPFKMHDSCSGALFYHNTCVKQGMPLVLYTSDAVRRCVLRNNLFIGNGGKYAFECTAPMKGCDFDYDGFGGGPWGNFLKWNEMRYPSLADVQARAPVYRHAALVDPATAFASGLRIPTDVKQQYAPAVNDPRLKAGSAAIDVGEILPGFNDGYRGKAPDLGALELDDPLPQFGPRPRPR